MIVSYLRLFLRRSVAKRDHIPMLYYVHTEQNLLDDLATAYPETADNSFRASQLPSLTRGSICALLDTTVCPA